MEVNEFSSLFLNTLSEKLLPKKNKEIVLLGDFNIGLLIMRFSRSNVLNFFSTSYKISYSNHLTLKNSNR